MTLLAKALLLDIDPNSRWISSLLEGGPAPPQDVDAKDALDREPEASSDHTALVADGQEHVPHPR